ncbi:MAG: MaoC/PaaZ C-terminal domain-containing protein [Syntrophobacteraceae bacterium]
MGLNLDVIGKKMGPVSFSYNQDSVILYALGIGAGVDELDLVYERDLKVFPTFAVVPLMTALFSFASTSGMNLLAVLHAEQKTVLHSPIPPCGVLHTWTSCEAIHDKGDTGAFANLVCETRDDSGTLLFENIMVVLDRSAGNFGGDPGPKSLKLDPPEGLPPAFHVEQKTSPSQAALYRLSGDKNPLHIDPEFAKRAGLNRPILHGLCSFGFSARAIVGGLGLKEPSRLKSFGVRFMNMVYPGDTLITEGWKLGEGRYIIRATNQDGKVVLGNGSALIDE